MPHFMVAYRNLNQQNLSSSVEVNTMAAKPEEASVENAPFTAT
jgi:hypothetical protein